MITGRRRGEEKTLNYVPGLSSSTSLLWNCVIFLPAQWLQSETNRARTKERQGWLELLERVGFDVLYRMVNEPRLPPQLSVSIYPPPPTQPHTYTQTKQKKERQSNKKVQHKKGRQKEVIFLTCRHPKQNDASMEFQITFSVSTNAQKRDECGWELRGVRGWIV